MDGSSVLNRSHAISNLEKFRTLAKEWKESQGVTSSLDDICMLPSYQMIIGMGEKAVPFILDELKKQPDHWFWALKAIVGEDPIPEEYRGDMVEMTRRWLEWGRKKGY